MQVKFDNIFAITYLLKFEGFKYACFPYFVNVCVWPPPTIWVPIKFLQKNNLPSN